MSFDDDERVPDDGVRIIGADEAAERIASVVEARVPAS